MERDLSECEIRVPTGGALERLYEFLSECFPPDRPVLEEMARTGKRFYTWSPYALCRGGDVLGNVSLMPMRIWLDGRVTPVVGVASVATAPQYRRQGVATHLLRYASSLVDSQGAACVLFTGLPGMYERVGFQPVAQEYLAARVSRLNFSSRGFDCELLVSLDDDRLASLARTYGEAYPNYDGKIDRDTDYWRLYAMLFNLVARSQLAICRRGGAMLGYARFDRDDDRITVCELCAEPSAVEVCEALLGFLQEQASRVGAELVSFALPPGHFAWPVLCDHGVALGPEPVGVARETFMVRPAPGPVCPGLLRLPWSLADKF
jgi:predicted acetyltransferase